MVSEEIDIKIVTETLTLTGSGNVTGEIYFSTQRDVFLKEDGVILLL